jgi:hypothetical protein
MEEQLVQQVAECLEGLHIDAERLALGKKRMAAIWRNADCDCIPLIYADAGASKNAPPFVDYREMFESPLKQFLFHVPALKSQSHVRSDAQLTVRANLGTGFVPTLAGLTEEVFPDKMPWLQEHLTRQEIEDFEMPEDISVCGLMPFAIQCYEFYREFLPPGIHSYMPDTQGPFDIAHQLRGDEIFLDIYDNPALLHHLMDISTELYIRATRKLKEVSGEAMDAAYHTCMYMAGGGVRLCEDTTTLISRDAIQEFVLPYIKRALKEFGGGWVHYCGKNDHLFDLLLDVDDVRGINLGNPEMHDFHEIMERILAKGKVYFGSVRNLEARSAREYFEFVLGALKGRKKGLIFVSSSDDANAGSNEAVTDLWYELQE